MRLDGVGSRFSLFSHDTLIRSSLASATATSTSCANRKSDYVRKFLAVFFFFAVFSTSSYKIRKRFEVQPIFTMFDFRYRVEAKASSFYGFWAMKVPVDGLLAVSKVKGRQMLDFEALQVVSDHLRTSRSSTSKAFPPPSPESRLHVASNFTNLRNFSLLNSLSHT